VQPGFALGENKKGCSGSTGLIEPGDMFWGNAKREIFSGGAL